MDSEQVNVQHVLNYAHQMDAQPIQPFVQYAHLMPVMFWPMKVKSQVNVIHVPHTVPIVRKTLLHALNVKKDTDSLSMKKEKAQDDAANVQNTANSAQKTTNFAHHVTQAQPWLLIQKERN